MPYPLIPICVISKENYNAHTAPLFKHLGILSFDKLILQARLNFMHSILNSFTKNNNCFFFVCFW